LRFTCLPDFPSADRCHHHRAHAHLGNEIRHEQIRLDEEEQTAFPPVNRSRSIGWNLAEPCKQIEVLAVAHARQGTEDVTVVNELEFARTAAARRQPFQFIAPQDPYSFSGKLISC
jgi:hypothetical protein